MRIKRFKAPDMRTALRRVREEQGSDAVILSSHQLAEGGVEVVAATDYDEALVQQALRSIATPAAAAPAIAAEAPMRREPIPNTHERAVFHIDGAPAAPASFDPQTSPVQDIAKALRRRIEPVFPAIKPAQHDVSAPAPAPAPVPKPELPAAPPAISRAAAIAPEPPPPAPPREAVADSKPQLRMVETDPAVVALRSELASMRKMIERELGQFSSERLRGSPARAAALDLLAGFGCDETLAQQIATQLDPSLPQPLVLDAVRSALAERLTIMDEEPLETGGCIALLGPTGAGKTTTIAKLAARYAARHGARDVAVISADNERAGAREQLHVLGRKMGITVCDADGPEALTHALEQLADYPLVLIDTAGYGLRDRALLRQILWVRAASNVRCLLVLPANAHPADLAELMKRYRPAAPEGIILTKLDESTRPGAALSVLVQHNQPMAYTTAGQRVPDDLELADARSLVGLIEAPRSTSAASPLHDDGHHAIA